MAAQDYEQVTYNSVNGAQIGKSSTEKVAFWGATPVARQTALTAQLTAITHTAPGTPDYALQDLVQNTGFGFATADEGNSVLKVIANLQARLAEIETVLENLGIVATN